MNIIEKFPLRQLDGTTKEEMIYLVCCSCGKDLSRGSFIHDPNVIIRNEHKGMLTFCCDCYQTLEIRRLSQNTNKDLPSQSAEKLKDLTLILNNELCSTVLEHETRNIKFKERNHA